MKDQVRRGQWSWQALIALTPVDVVSAAIYLGVLVAHALGAAAPAAEWHRTLSVLLVLTLFGVDRAEALRFPRGTPTRVAIALLVARIALMGAVVQLGASGLAWFLLLIPPYRVCLYFGNRFSYITAGVIWASFCISHWAGSPDISGENQDIILFAMALVFVCTVANALREERASRQHGEELLAELACSHTQLQAHADMVAELATTEERNRLARDIHDSLGHYLTVTNVQIAKALAFQYRDPPVAEQAMQHAKDTAHEALRAVRQSVGALRTPPDVFRFSGAMTALMERTRTDACVLAAHVEGSEAFFAPETLTALYFVAQEALTNVQKHADATAVSIHACFGESEASLKVRDNGRGFCPDAKDASERGVEGGYGLQSMRDRLARVGGRLIVASSPGAGTVVTAVAPRIAVTAAAFASAAPEG